MSGRGIKRLLIPLFSFSPGQESPTDTKAEKATFAGGCFWCIESAFDHAEGVIEAVSGYTGGSKPDPTYEEVSSGRTGHLEAVEVTYDPSKITYPEILEIFWEQIDPTDSGGRFVDRGSRYRSAIFYHNDEQRRMAEESKKMLEQSGGFDRPIATEIRKASAFYRAEEYHQDYYRKNAQRYDYYRSRSGCEGYVSPCRKGLCPVPGLEKGGPKKEEKRSEEDLKLRLSPLQYRVTQECGTEPPFRNEYWDNKREGIYVDVVSGEVLFSSLDKFDSGTGWPSFTKPVEPGNIEEKTDKREPFHDQDRGQEQGRQVAPRPRVRRRTRAHGQALLHQLRLAALHPKGGHGKGGIWGIPALFGKVKSMVLSRAG